MCQVATEAKQACARLEAAKADNVALVERLRYVQGYQSRRKGALKFLEDIFRNDHCCCASPGSCVLRCSR